MKITDNQDPIEHGHRVYNCGVKSYPFWKTSFLIDSGATSHMCNNRSMYLDWEPYHSSKPVYTSTGQIIMAMGTGNIRLPAGEYGNQEEILLTNVMYVPQLMNNLISVPVLDSRGYTIHLSNNMCTIKDGKIILQGERHEEVYIVKSHQNTQVAKNTRTTENEEINLEVISSEPETWDQVKSLPESEKSQWIKAMKKEIADFNSSDTWTPETTLCREDIISTRWTFKVKRDESHHVSKIRARLVARGYEQAYGTHFDESYAPVVKPQTLRLLLIMSQQNSWPIRHIDFDSAFLYGKVKEKIYVSTPKGTEHLFGQNQVYRLKAAIYGLKQAAHEWYNRISNSLKQLQYLPCLEDQCLFINRESSHITYMVIHVDDLLICGSIDTKIEHTIEALKGEYALKDLGLLKCYLGLYIDQVPNKKEYRIQQRLKITQLLEHTNQMECIPAKTPMLMDYLTGKKQDTSKKIDNPKLYQSILGTILYLSNNSRPDLSLAAGILGRSAFAPSETDWDAIMRTVRYIKGTQDYALTLGQVNRENLITYSDADWGGDPTTRRSTSGRCHMYLGSLISWGSSRQNCVSISTAEAEYIAAVEAAKETVWIIRLMEEMQAPITKPSLLRCDNQSAIAIASSLKTSTKTKHMDIRLHYLRQLIDQGIIHMQYCRSQIMLADVFTKPLHQPRMNILVRTIGLKPEESQRYNQDKPPQALTYDERGNTNSSKKDWYETHNLKGQSTNLDSETLGEC